MNKNVQDDKLNSKVQSSERLSTKQYPNLKHFLKNKASAQIPIIEQKYQQEISDDDEEFNSKDYPPVKELIKKAEAQQKKNTIPLSEIKGAVEINLAKRLFQKKVIHFK